MPGDPSDVLGVEERELLARIAAMPRPTGGEALRAARAACADRLRRMGYSVRELPFEFSAFPGRYGTPLVGALVMAMVAVAGHWGARGARVFPFALLVIAGTALALFGRWLARHGVLDSRLMRERGVNLEAIHPGALPRVWLCAHLDTKSQPVPTLVRACGIVLESIGAGATLLLAAAAVIGIQFSFEVWVAAALMTLVGSIPVVLSVVGTRSPGALDNASGVVTVLAAAEQLSYMEGIGVLLTDAEELGLAGAHSWASSRAPTIILNIDGVDDEGEVTVMAPGGTPRELRVAVEQASRECGVTHRLRGIPPGLLTDSVGFAQYGSASVTFSRGSWASLARVHSARDDLTRLDGRGIPEVAKLMAATARVLASPARDT